MTDTAFEWLFDRQGIAQDFASWQEFCKSEGPLGEHFAKYGWLAKHWEFLKIRGFMTHRTICYPNARAYTDLFESAKIVRQRNLGPRKGTAFDYPAGYRYIREDTIAGHYGGQRSVDTVRNVRQHYGATFCVCGVKPRADIETPQFPTDRNFRLEDGNFEAIKWESSGQILITSHASNSIGSEWVAVLDEGDSLESLLNVADQEFLASERAMESEAYRAYVEVSE